MATIFWESQGIILIGYLEEGKIVTGAYYATSFNRFKEELKQKQPRLAHKQVLFPHDNAPSHKLTVTMAKLH